MGPWRKLIEVLWKASRSLEINSSLGRIKLHIRAVDPGIILWTLVMISHKAESTKPDDDVLQEKDMIATIPRKLGNTIANCEDPIA
jgi:hypothetical protein